MGERSRNEKSHNLKSSEVAFSVFTSRSACSARTAGTKIVLRFPRLFVCASTLITCAIYYVIRYYATAVNLASPGEPTLTYLGMLTGIVGWVIGSSS